MSRIRAQWDITKAMIWLWYKLTVVDLTRNLLLLLLLLLPAVGVVVSVKMFNPLLVECDDG